MLWAAFSLAAGANIPETGTTFVQLLSNGGMAAVACITIVCMQLLVNCPAEHARAAWLELYTYGTRVLYSVGSTASKLYYFLGTKTKLSALKPTPSFLPSFIVSYLIVEISSEGETDRDY